MLSFKPVSYLSHMMTTLCYPKTALYFLAFSSALHSIDMKVVVIGAGISGATSAFRIKRKFPEAEIKILYSESSPNTTSDIAAGW